MRITTHQMKITTLEIMKNTVGFANKAARRCRRLAVVMLMLAVGGVMAVGQNAKPFVIPELKSWTGGEGTLALTNASRIVYYVGGEGAAKALADDWAEMFGTKMTVIAGKKAEAGDILLKIVPTKSNKKGKKYNKAQNGESNPESYTIQINDCITISAPTATGLYWATRTLLQMGEGNKDHALSKGQITDWPDFTLRGFLLDCGRKYIPMSYLQKLVRIMGYYKMNTLQVHLNDNGFPKYYNGDWKKTYAAFRLECDTYPGLTARDGSYSKQEFRDFQKLAKENGVDIIPEIDAPAHSLAFTHYDEELANPKYGVDHLDITKQKSWDFLDGLWKEYISGPDPVFMGKRVHIGTDEYSNRDQEVVEKFRALADHMIKYVESYGKQAVMWGSLTHARGTTPVKSKDVLMSLWYNGYAQPDSMVNELGYQGISIPDGLTYIVPHAGYYYDYLNTQYLYEKWTPNIVANEKNTFPYDDRSKILGGMFAVWNDVCGNGVSVKDIHHRVFPAMQTLSAKFWTGKNVSVPFKDFDVKRLALSEAPGINELGRLNVADLNIGTLAPNTDNVGKGNVEAGYNYSVSFHINAKQEQKGTVLLSSPNATFYLSDPISGRFAFARDGYLYTFDYVPYPGEQADITIEGDNKGTRLFVNGKLAEDKTGNIFWTDGKNSVTTLETLVFPLQKSGNFQSQITDFRVADRLVLSGKK